MELLSNIKVSTKKTFEKISEISKKIIKNIDKPSMANYMYITVIFITFTIVLLPILNYFTDKYNIKCDELPFNVYLGLSTLMIPLAIFIAEKISDSKDALISNIYLKKSYLFPMIIFQIDSFVALLLIKNFLYYLILILVYTILLTAIYIRVLKLFSDTLYFSKKIKEETKNIIDEDIDIHIDSVDTNLKWKKLASCGIFYMGYDYIDDQIYKKEYLYADDEDLLIQNIDNKKIRSLISIMSEINSNETNSNLDYVEEMKNKKILIFLQKEGYTTKKGNPIIKILYIPDKESIEQLKKIRTIVKDLYKYSNNNLDLIIRKELEDIENICSIAICNHSVTELSNNLKKYSNFYSALVDNINDNIDKTYSLKEMNRAIHSIDMFKGFKYFEYIKKEIYNLCCHPNVVKNQILFNQLVSCVYSLLLYSYNKKELISFCYIISMYEYFSYQIGENPNLSYDKIQLELFEILNYIFYELRNEKSDNHLISKHMIIYINITIVNIMYKLAYRDVKKYNIFRKKFEYFISRIIEELENKKYNQNIIEILKDLLLHCSSNLFAMDSYLFNKANDEMKNDILKYYNSKEFEYVSEAFLKCHELDFDSIYNWDDWENREYNNEDEMYSIFTSEYLNNLFCNICVNHQNIIIPVNNQLQSLYSCSLKTIFDKLNISDDNPIIKKFDEMLEIYKENKDRKSVV